MLRSLASVLDSESLSADEFVKEFASISDPVAQAQSRLPQAAQLQKDVDALKGVSPQLDQMYVPVTLSVDYGDGKQDILVSDHLARDLLAQIPDMVVHEILAGIVRDSLTHVFEEIAADVSLRNIKATRVLPPGQDLATTLSLFFSSAPEGTPRLCWRSSTWAPSRAKPLKWVFRPCARPTVKIAPLRQRVFPP